MTARRCRVAALAVALLADAGLGAQMPNDELVVQPPQPAARMLPCYFVLGQSNAIGVTGGIWYLLPTSLGPNGERLDHLFRQEDLKIWAVHWQPDGAGGYTRVSEGFETYQAADFPPVRGNANPDLENNGGPTGLNLCGPEAALGHELVRYHNGGTAPLQGPVHLIKMAVISYLGDTPDRDFPEWNPPGAEQYPQLVARWRAAQAAVAPDVLVPLGAFWIQGEQDIRYDETKRFYGENLLELANTLRQDVGAPDLPFVVAELHDGYDVGRPPPAFQWMPHILEIRREQHWAAARDPFMTLVDTDAFPRALHFPMPDPRHYDEVGTVMLGRALFDALRNGPFR